MSNPAVQLADAVAAAIDAPFAIPSWPAATDIHVKRTYQPTHDLEDLEDLQITVTPAAMDMNPLGRGEYERRVGVLVAVQTQVGPEQTDRLDELADLVHQISEYLTDLALSEMPDARFTSIENDPLYHPDILETKRVFLAPMLVTYRLLN